MGLGTPVKYVLGGIRLDNLTSWEWVEELRSNMFWVELDWII